MPSIIVFLWLSAMAYYTLESTGNKAIKTITFSYTGAPQYFVVPFNVYSASVTLYGGAGGNDYCANAYGGYGGIAKADITVTPQSTLCIVVGW